MFNKTWPHYHDWFLKEGIRARPGYLTCRDKLKQYMPELFPVYEQLVNLVGGGDIEARYLSMYCPPPYMSGCTQLAWTSDRVTLMRNYDYSPKLFEGVMLYSDWLQPVIGISDCNWGLLDGMNAAGLSASLAFGGRKNTGKGFGIPLLMRYILETCDTVAAAIEQLRRVPVHMSYNVTLVDKFATYATVYLSPDRPVVVTKERVGVNHQQAIEWHDYAAFTATQERLDVLKALLADPNQIEETILGAFFRSPVCRDDAEKDYQTLYTTVYRPQELTATLYHLGGTVVQSFSGFVEQETVTGSQNIMV